MSDVKITMVLDAHSSPEDKVTLFRELFRGRQDVYSRRFESRKTGKAGYSPVCANEWVQGICEKPRIKCTECPHRRFLPLTDEVIRWHLSGQDDDGRNFVLGVYPMLEDETCFFLATDFDKSTWREDSKAFLETCQRMKLPAALERSRSGNGGHIWFFFSEAIPATLARKLGSYVLTETMERRPAPKVLVEREAPPKLLCIAGWRPCRKQPGDSVSMPSCPFLSMAGAEWKWTCSARMHDWRSS